MESQEIVLKETNGEMTVESREIAMNFSKRHSDVLEKITLLEKDISENQPTEKSVCYFIPSEYQDEQGKMRKEYLLTRDGFSLIVMGFTGKKALDWKLKYIKAFNKMELALKQTSENKTLATVEDKKLITDIKNTLDEVKRATMVLTHKDKLDLTKHIIYPTLELHAVKSECKKEVTKLIKENLFVNGKWENIRIDDNFNRAEFKEEVRNTVEIIKQNNPLFFKNAEYETISMFD